VTSPAVRAAVYTVFAARWISRWMVNSALVFAGLCVVYVAGVCVYYVEPWYDHDMIRQLSAPGRAAQLVDVSEQAAAIFPDGTTYHAAAALLRANGFSCHDTQAEAQQITVSCRREPHVPLCAESYTVELSFDRAEHMTDRKASSYYVCL
jgi:hypothetical protein